MALTRLVHQDTNDAGTSGTILDVAWETALYDLIDQRWHVDTWSTTGAQHNFPINVTGTEADVLVFTNPTDLTLTGFAAPASPAKPGKPLHVIAAGTGHVFLAYNSLNSSVGNRMVHPVTSGPLPLAGGYGRVSMLYNSQSSRWDVMTHTQGAPITPVFNAADYTASTGSWTVAAGDVVACRYTVVGHFLECHLELQTTDVSATPTTLIRTLPGGYTVLNAVDYQPALVSNAGGALAWSLATVGGGTAVAFTPTVSGGAWATGANTSVRGRFRWQLV